MALGDAPEAGASLLWFKPSVRSGELFSSSHCLGTWVRPCPVARPLPEGHLRMKAGLRMALWVLWGTLKASSPHRQPAPSETSWHGLSVPGWCLEAAGWVPIPSGPPPRHALRQRGSVVPSIRWARWHISWRTVGPSAVCPRSVSGTPRPPHLSSSCRIASSDARGPRPSVGLHPTPCRQGSKVSTGASDDGEAKGRVPTEQPAPARDPQPQSMPVYGAACWVSAGNSGEGTTGSGATGTPVPLTVRGGDQPPVWSKTLPTKT